MIALLLASIVEIAPTSELVPHTIPLDPPPGATTVTVDVTTHYVEFYAIENTAPFAKFVAQSGVRHVSTVVTAPFYVMSQSMDIYSERHVTLAAFDGSLDYRGPSSSISQATPQSFIDSVPMGISFPLSALPANQLTVNFSVGRQFTRASDTSVFLISAVGATVEISYQ